ncbi:hypothetical protein BJ741DRAFT_608122 [Chytriomyces cf. hyalinus JEL632]|nr:hypothetical protein BJ741DRAFT_608122 [Chytriomyces cf. hyalinus JEL632]
MSFRVAPVPASPPDSSILCATPGCNKCFDSKDARKEHQFQYHSNPRIRFKDRSETQFIKRDADGFLRCSCSTYKVLTVGGMKRHAKKCLGYPKSSVLNPEDLPFNCVVDHCEKRYKTKNALAVHVYEYHSSPKIRFMGESVTTVIPRSSDGYLECPCGTYRVITTAAMLKHVKGCSGESKVSNPTPPESKYEFFDWNNFNLTQPAHGNIFDAEFDSGMFTDTLTDDMGLSPRSFGSFSMDQQQQLFQPLMMPWNDELCTLYLDLVD